MSYLNYDDFLDIGMELEEGQKVRVNHLSAGCDGDSKSMLIERKDNGDISAYCFRCGSSGFHRTGFTPKSKSVGGADAGATGTSGHTMEIPFDASGCIDDWPSYARVWVRKNGITDDEVKRYGILYSTSTDRVILPVYGEDGKLCFYQTRQVNTTDTRPKYLTVRTTDSVNAIVNVLSDTVVLVEDYLSGIKVGRILPVLVLHGTVIRDIHIKWLIENKYSTFIIWLDDDNSQVKKNTLKNKKVLDKLGSCVVIHTGGRDPKDHSEEEIKDLTAKHI